MSILSRLFALLALASLPAIAIQAYHETSLRRARWVEVQDQALSLAQLAAKEQEQIVQGIRQVLIALSELPAIKSKNSEACNAALAGMKSRFPAFLTFVVSDLNGQPFCDTNRDREAVNVAGRAYFANVLKTGAFTVGQFSIGLSVRQKLIQFALPFLDEDGQIAGVIIAPLGLDWLGNYIARAGVPEGDALAITDRDGTVLARYPENDRFVGKKLNFVEADKPNWENLAADLVDADGVERIVGVSMVEPGGLHVSYGLNKKKAFGEIQRRTRRDIFLIAMSSLLVWVMTLLGARQFIHRPLELLVDAANQWRLGDYSRRVNIRDRSEIASVAGAFNAMAAALESRERQFSDAKEKAETAAARLAMVFESTTDSVVIADADWRISFFNQRAWDDIKEGRELIGMDLREAIFGDHDEETLAQLQATMSDRRPAVFEAHCRRRDAWYTVNAFPSGEGIGIFFRDITEHRRAVDARHHMEEQLHQSRKMESVGQLTGGVAHDFNNLLAVVSGNLELIEDVADNSKVRRLAAAARRATDQGAKLTTQLLAFSRRQKLDPKLLDVNVLISEFEGLIRQAIGAGCELRLKTDEQLWRCTVDPSLLETALLNLALNGRDAMPSGGVLQIETQNVVLEEGAVAGCPPGSYVRLSVADTGHGMPPEVRDRIFEPFFTTKEVGKGTGLGLSMVYGFVRQSGGYISVESAPAVGTTVTVYLPKATQQELDINVEIERARAVPGGSERILLVEDNEDVLEVTSEMLTTFGYLVVCAKNGSEAIRLLEGDQEFDLMFSDVVMPSGPNGVELAREAKRQKGKMKILLTSGYAGDVLHRHGAVDEFPVIYKPFRVSELARRLRSVLEGMDEQTKAATQPSE
ncbi:ATP-binding protein [Bradyrhizobium sp. STM 3557]|uniref:ATP-binding protein n=1 Tax=Bradyrhizobium sp. STM 3557 TaxID=578920 RepID=UPI00388ECB32